MDTRRCGTNVAGLRAVGPSAFSVITRAGNPIALVPPWLVAHNTYVYLWVRGLIGLGIIAGLPVGKPYCLVDVESSDFEIYFEPKMSCENLIRILFTPYLVSL